MENVDSQDFVQEWNPEESSITENTTEKLFHVTGRKRSCDETQKHIIALLEKWNHPLEVKKELDEIWKDIALRTILELDRKRHEMSRNHNIDQYPWEATEDNQRKRELIKEISKIRGAKPVEKKIDKVKNGINLGRSAPQPEKSEMQKIWESQSLN